MNQQSSQEEFLRMKTIYKALEDGWTVKKSKSRTYEFTRSLDEKIPIYDDKYPLRRKAISSPIIKTSFD